jgi:hypothetical protein
MITHIIAVGDSFTYCQNLENRTENGWPYLLAKELGVEVVNLGVCGSSNDSIHRRTYEFVYNVLLGEENHVNYEFSNYESGLALEHCKTRVKLSNVQEIRPFFVIGWSMLNRREVWYNIDKYDNELNDYKTIDHPTSHIWDHYQHGFYANSNIIDDVRRLLLYKSSLINLFESLNIPFLMGDFDKLVSEHIMLNEEYKPYKNFIRNVYKNPYNVGSLDSVGKKAPVLEACGHYSVEGNFFLKEYLLEKIRELYPNLLLKQD